MRRTMSKRALVILLLAACKKPTQATRDAAPSTAVPIASASESAALDASRPETAAPVPEDTSHIDAIVTKWNAAHVAHDAAALRSLYGERVYFYGQMLAAADAAARKEAAFSKSKDYAQSVDAVSAKKRGDRWVVDFTKRAISAGRTTDYPSVLYVDARDRITLEMDKLDSQWCHANDQQIVPPFTINEAQAEAHMLRAHTIGGSVVVSGPDSRPFVQQLTCPDPHRVCVGRVAHRTSIARRRPRPDDGVLLPRSPRRLPPAESEDHRRHRSRLVRPGELGRWGDERSLVPRRARRRFGRLATRPKATSVRVQIDA